MQELNVRATRVLIAKDPHFWTFLSQLRDGVDMYRYI